MVKPITTSSEWSIPLIKEFDKVISELASEYGLDTYENQIEVITSEQMLDAYASQGLPMNYNHWSFGQNYIKTEQLYRKGYMGLAYEIVINSDPCIAYLMEENTMAMQALVIAHASYGHNSFFKGNNFFRTWTNADTIIDYLLFAKQYIQECEIRHGVHAVEAVLDSCHAVMNLSVNRFKHPSPLSLEEEERLQCERENILEQQVRETWAKSPLTERHESQKNFPEEPEENLLAFIEEHAPLLEPWQREIARIVRKLAQYFYPQRQTQVMNEGWACFWHYTILNEMYDRGYINNAFMMEVLHSHTNVVAQPSFDSEHYTGINVYALGYNMMQDIKRMSMEPTQEDELCFPDLVHKDWKHNLDFAMRNFKDESFILQYLSPKLIRDFRMFCITDDSSLPEYEISAIHDPDGYSHIRQQLSNHYNLSMMDPNIQIVSADIHGDRSLTLQHIQDNQIPLHESYLQVLERIHALWGFPVILEIVDTNGDHIETATYPCKEPAKKKEEFKLP